MSTQRRCDGKHKLAFFISCIATLSLCASSTAENLHAEFRNMLSPEEFRAQASACLQQLASIEALEASSLPLYGSIVTDHPARGTQAAKEGIQVGDIVTAIDEVDLIYQWSSWDRKRVPQILHYVTSKGEVKKFTIQPGSVGIMNKSYRRPDLWYIRHGQRNPIWDKYVLLALSAQISNTAVAEAAWTKAIKQGYRQDMLSLWSSVFIAHYQGNTEAAWNNSEQLRKLKSKPPLILFPREEYSVALANGEVGGMYSVIDASLSLGRPPLRHSTNDIEGLLQGIEQSRMPKMAPHQQAKNMSRVEITGEATALDSTYVSNNLFTDFQKGTPYRFKQRVGNFKDIYFGTKKPIHNAEIVTTFTIKNMPNKSYYALIFMVGMMDKNSDAMSDDGPAGKAKELMLSFEYDQSDTPTLRVGFSNLSKDFHTPAAKMKFDGQQVHTLRMIKVGNAGEIFLDGRRIAYVPLQANRDLSFLLKTVGTDVNILTFDTWDLSM